MRMYFAPTEDSTGLEVILRDDGLRLLRGCSVGRIAFVVDGQPVVVPVNYVMAGEDIAFRTGSGTKRDALRHERVAFEVDALDAERHTGWSVLVQGTAREVGDCDELLALERLALEPWASGSKPYWIRVTTETVTGRRITSVRSR